MAKKHYILFYDYVEDYLERRGEFREAHFANAMPYIQRGELHIAGAFADPADGAAFVFTADSADVPERLAKTDPYVLNGLVTSWRVREWTVVAGAAALGGE